MIRNLPRFALIGRSFSAKPAISEKIAAPPAISTSNKVTFYRRELPQNLVSFTSPEGKILFKESLLEGYSNNYFSLVGNFTSQSEPEFCGLGSLAMVLNALEMDPGKQWKGVWRWYTDDNLECCAPMESVKNQGITFREFSCLARCNGLNVVAKRGTSVSLENFIQDLEKVCSSNDLHMVVSFSRQALNQTGDGHFSPVGGFNKSRRKVLVLDTARFKYPSYYVDVDKLYNSMAPVDSVTGLPRGYFILSRTDARNKYYKPISLCKLTKSLGISNPKLASLFCHDIPSKMKTKNVQSIDEVVYIILDSVPAEYSSLIQLIDWKDAVDRVGPEEELAKKHYCNIISLLQETRKHPLFKHVHAVTSSKRFSSTRTDHYPEYSSSALATMFILATPDETFKTLPIYLKDQILKFKNFDNIKEPVLSEVSRISEQLSSLMNDYCQCGKK